MPGKIVQFPDRNKIADLLGKIIDHPIVNESVTRKNNRITIKVNFQDTTGALPVLFRCKQAGIEPAIIKHDAAQEFKFSFDDNQTTVENLHEKLRKVIAKRLVGDMDGTLSAFSENPDMMKKAANDIFQVIEKAIDNPGHEVQNPLARPIVRRFLEELDKSYESSLENTKKTAARQILKDAATQLGVKPDRTPNK